MGAAVIAAVLLACAPNVAPVTLEAIIQVESAGNPLALYVNGARTQPPPAKDAREAAQVATRFIQRGYSVDLGLMQVNSRNLAALGMTVEQVLDPCANVRTGATILTADYAAAVRSRGPGEAALQAALSAYNTGDFQRGFANGYVARFYGPFAIPAVGHVVAVGAATARAAPPAPPSPFTADSTVFAREVTNVRIE